MPVSRKKNRAAWFMSASKCPVTGLPLTFPESLTPPTAGDFHADMVKIGDRILLVKCRGYADSESESGFLSFFDGFVQRHFPAGEKLIFMEDYADVTGTDSGARKQYIAYFANAKNLLAGIVFNVTAMLKISFNLFKKLHPAGFKAHAVSTYAEAMALALKFLEPAAELTETREPETERMIRTGKKGSGDGRPPHALGARISDTLKTGKNALTKKTRQGLAREFSDELIRYIASIDWRTSGIAPPDKILDDGVSAAKVFDAISFVKSEMDAILAERTRAEAVLRESEAQLLEYQKKLKGLAVRLSMAEEGQRRDMASRLHETIGQELFVLLLQLDRFEKKLELPDKIPAVHQMRDQVLKIIRETKDLTFDLSPPALYDFGFREATEALARTISARHGIRVHTDFEGEMDAIGDEIKIIVYRCLKELIHNTVKHAHAEHIHVRLENNSAGLRVAYRDDGVGFDADAAGDCLPGRSGFGLFDIREKMGHLGGELVVDSRPGEGVAIRMAMPLAIPG